MTQSKQSWQAWTPLLLVPPSQVSWANYARYLNRMGVQRVFLSAAGLEYNGEFDLKPWDHYARLLERAIVAFKRRGIATGFWLGPTFGWNVLGASSAFPFQELVGSRGETAQGVACPLDPGFRTYMCEVLKVIAGTGVEMILLEDDYRLHLRAPEVPFGCFCPLHLCMLEKETGSHLTREEVVQFVLKGTPNPVRDAFLKVAGESLLGLAAEMEAAVHSVNPAVRLGPALVMTHWSNEGIDVKTFLKTLAGDTKPFARTIGAPYWSNETWETAFVGEYTRLQGYWLRDFPLDLVAEGDGFPHTRYNTTAAGLHAFEQSLLASGFPGVFRYAFSYATRPEYEPGYVEKAARSKTHYQALRDFFPPEYQDWGVDPAVKPNAFASRTIPEGVPNADMGWYDEPLHLHILPRLGVPIGWDDRGPAFLCGDLSANYSEAELSGLLNRGVVLDAPAAIHLQRLGIDTGCLELQTMAPPRMEWFSDPRGCGKYQGQFIWLITPGSDAFYQARAADGANVITWMCGPDRQPVAPGVFHYENKQGQRFCILPLDLRKGWWRGKGQEMINYCRQEQLQRSLGWVNRRPLPVCVDSAPNVHIICRADPDGGRLAIGVQNLSMDQLPQPTLRLASRIAIPAQLELLKHDGRKPVLSDDYTCTADGETQLLKINQTIPSMGMLSIGLPQR